MDNMKKKHIRISIFIILFGLLNIVSILSDEPMNINNSLENILERRNIVVEIYLIPIDFYTRVPVNEIAIRESFAWKIIISSRVLEEIRDLLFAAQRQMNEQSQPLDIRVLIDLIIDNEIIYTIPLSHGVRNELLEAFHNLLRVPL